MPDPSIPLVNRGTEALEALLNYDDAKADAQVRLLTMSELTYLKIAARQLSALAEKYVQVVHRYPDGWAFRCWLCGHLGLRFDSEQAARNELEHHQCTPDTSPSPSRQLVEAPGMSALTDEEWAALNPGGAS